VSAATYTYVIGGHRIVLDHDGRPVPYDVQLIGRRWPSARWRRRWPSVRDQPWPSSRRPSADEIYWYGARLLATGHVGWIAEHQSSWLPRDYRQQWTSEVDGRTDGRTPRSLTARLHPLCRATQSIVLRLTNISSIITSIKGVWTMGMVKYRLTLNYLKRLCQIMDK